MGIGITPICHPTGFDQTHFHEWKPNKIYNKFRSTLLSLPSCCLPYWIHPLVMLLLTIKYKAASPNSLDGNRDETGASPTAWAVWTRAWTVEENRHGDLLNKYFYLSGRVDMKPIEKTIQYLIGSGLDHWDWEKNNSRAAYITDLPPSNLIPDNDQLLAILHNAVILHNADQDPT